MRHCIRGPHHAPDPTETNHPTRSAATPVVLFDHQLSRAQHHPQAFLNGYTGKLISDGYLAWRSLQGVTHFGCWAHARRRFDEALKASPQKDGRAEQAPTLIRR